MEIEKVVFSELEKIRTAARDAYPNEMCGIIDEQGVFIVKENISSNKRNNFEMCNSVYSLLVDNKIHAIVHSHTNGRRGPSETDMVQQISTNVPWVIVETDGNRVSKPVIFGDGCEDSLLGREYLYGKNDCWSLVRDFFKERRVFINEFPREDEEIFSRGINAFIDNYKSHGFAEVEDEPRESDVCLMSIRCDHGISNHCGVLVEDDLILHHLYNRKSVKEPLYRWQKYITGWYRHQEFS